MLPPRAPTLIEIAIEPRDERDRPRLLAALAANDGDGERTVDAASGQIVLGGSSEAQLDASIAALRDRAGIALNIGAPQIAYRETIARPIEMDTTHKKPVAGGGFDFARVKLAFEPAEGWSFATAASGVPTAYLAGIEAGLASGRRAGVLGGYPVVDLKTTLVDGAWHETDSSSQAFEAATLTAFRHALKEVGVMLEPIMLVELTVGTAFATATRDDLYLRRGEIEDRVDNDDHVIFVARVPFANLLGSASSLRQFSQGTGSFHLTFSHFAQIPRPDPPDFPGSMAVRA